ncbi:hypothetical protein HN630_00105 [archaeon]|jgi:hypothetical protein|nr:hypothetical protein [archaeon]
MLLRTQLKTLFLLSFLITSFNAFSQDKNKTLKCEFDIKNASPGVSLHKLRAGLRGKALHIRCNDGNIINFKRKAVTKLFQKELDGESVRRKRHPKIYTGSINVTVIKHDKTNFEALKYSWNSANGGTKNIPPTKGILPKPKPIKCGMKSRQWLAKPENAKKCRKIKVCYRGAQNHLIAAGICKKVK